MRSFPKLIVLGSTRSLSWCCSFTLAVSVAPPCCYPSSTISNEVPLPKSWYMKWLNSSLIHGIWSMIFTLTNVALTPPPTLTSVRVGSQEPGGEADQQSQGDAGDPAPAVGGGVWLIMYILAALIDRDQSMDTWSTCTATTCPSLLLCQYLGVLLLLVCTPRLQAVSLVAEHCDQAAVPE